MNEYDYRYRKKNKSKKVTSNFKSFIIRIFNQILLSIILLLGSLIAIKTNDEIKTFIYDEIYQKTFHFTKVNNWYQKYFGNIFPLDKFSSTPVFSENITYSEASIYKDGVKLRVTNNYLVPFLESGIVVFIGEKEEYGNTIIVQQVNGIDVWYSNVSISNIKMYDYVEKGSLLGECNSDFLYMVFQKDGGFLDYKEFI